MASGQVHVTFAAIEDAADRVGLANREIQTELNDLYTLLQPMVATWSGEAAEGFQYQHGKWVQAAEDLNEVLGAISRLLLDSHGAYTQAESAAHALWGE